MCFARYVSLAHDCEEHALRLNQYSKADQKERIERVLSLVDLAGFGGKFLWKPGGCSE